MPFELWEIVLVKAAVKLYQTAAREADIPGRITFSTLTSVCFLWHVAFVKRFWFRKAVRRIIDSQYYFMIIFNVNTLIVRCFHTQLLLIPHNHIVL
jgi:hypothetical protein